MGAVVVVVHEQVHRIRDVLRQQAVGRDSGRNDLVAAVLGSLPQRLVERAVAHPAVNIVHALDLGRVGGDAHHLAVDGRHQHVADRKPVAWVERTARRRPRPRPRVGARQLLAHIVRAEHRHVDDLQPFEVGHPEPFSGLDHDREPGRRRQNLRERRIRPVWLNHGPPTPRFSLV